jgi:hypothetical protein
MTIETIFATIKEVLRKNRKGSLKDSQIQTAVRVGINNYFDNQLRLYRATGSVPSTLRPLLRTVPVQIINGVGLLPLNFAKEVTFYVYNVNSMHADFLGRQEFEERKNSVLMPPTEIDPVGYIEDGNVLVRPINLSSIQFSYIKKPVEIVYNTTPTEDNRDTVFNIIGSIDTEFAIESVPDIVKEALQFIGVPQQDEGAIQLGEKAKI